MPLYMCFILLGGVLTSFFLYNGLTTIFTYIVLIFDIYIYIYDDVCLLHLPLHVLFLFSLYTCFLFYVCNLLFLFHTKMLDEFYLKCFRKIGCQNLSSHGLSSCKVFQEFVLG